MDLVLSHKASGSTFQITGMIQIIGIKLEYFNKKDKTEELHLFKSLKTYQVTHESKKNSTEILKYLAPDSNENTAYHNLWDSANGHIERNLSSQMNMLEKKS